MVGTPIAEASFTGMAVGAALVGCRPVVEILFIDFAMLVMDQIVNQAAKYEFISGGQGKVPMVLRTQGGAGNGLAAQHSQSLEALFYHIPGLKVVMPATPRDACGLLKAAIRDDNPVIFIEHKLLYMTQAPVPDEEYVIPLGKADIKKPGRDATIITYSYMTLKCLEAAAALENEGISVEVVDLRTLTPLDKETILRLRPPDRPGNGRPRGVQARRRGRRHRGHADGGGLRRSGRSGRFGSPQKHPRPLQRGDRAGLRALGGGYCRGCAPHAIKTAFAAVIPRCAAFGICYETIVT